MIDKNFYYEKWIANKEKRISDYLIDGASVFADISDGLSDDVSGVVSVSNGVSGISDGFVALKVLVIALMKIVVVLVALVSFFMEQFTKLLIKCLLN